MSNVCQLNLTHSIMNYRSEWIVLGALSALCFLLSIFRVFYSDSPAYLFLNWNLFLAGVPWLIAKKFENSAKRQKTIPLLIAGTSWLLFFPNAPYIFTDLFHLRAIGSMPIWFDLILILSFAWTGMLFGFSSLFKLEKIFTLKFGRKPTQLAITSLLFASAFGVYIGRFLRWNSWDILQNPGALLYDVAHRFIYPFEHPRTWGMTLLFGLLLNIMYWTMKMFAKNTSSQKLSEA